MMHVELTAEAEVLLRRVEEAAGSGSVRLTPLLIELARVAPEGSRAWAYALRLLAERSVESHPWRASLLAKKVVDVWSDDDLAWAILALAQSLLGNHRFAVSAYRRALALAPHNPWYAHNLGHLYDIALDRPRRAVPLLRRAAQALPDHPEVTASYAHALVRAGEPHKARALMVPLMRRGASPDHHDLYRFIVQREDDCLRELMSQTAHPGTRRSRKRRYTR